MTYTITLHDLPEPTMKDGMLHYVPVEVLTHSRELALAVLREHEKSSFNGPFHYQTKEGFEIHYKFDMK